MKLEPGKAMLIRIIVLAAALLLSGAVFVLAPRKQFWGTSIGKHSLTIYLIHAAVIFPLRFTDFFGSLTGVGKIAVIGSDRKSTRLNSSHVAISYAVFCSNKHRLRG